MGVFIKHQCQDDGGICHRQEVVTTIYVTRSRECPSEDTDTPTTAHGHSAPCWEQEGSLFVKFFTNLCCRQCLLQRRAFQSLQLNQQNP